MYSGAVLTHNFATINLNSLTSVIVAFKQLDIINDKP